MNVKDGTAVFKVMDKRMQAMVDMFFPVGTIVTRNDDTKPEFMNYGTWEKIAADRVLQGGGGEHLPGTDVEAGLPNITGSFVESSDGVGRNTSGVFTYKFKSGGWVSGGSGGERNTISIDASIGSSIYGNSDTVQPPAHIVTFWLRTA